ncbi:MAG: hypothetical protein IJ620_00090 [Bacteroidales bacterium]|nr:hypothetical protein [Bacteroidales bacterium]
MTEEDIENTYNPYVAKPMGCYDALYDEEKQKVNELVNSGRTDLSEKECLFLLEKYYCGCGLTGIMRYYHPIYVCLLSQKSKKVRQWVYQNHVWCDATYSAADLKRLYAIWNAWQQYHDATAAVILMLCAPLEWEFVTQHLEALKESARKGRYGEKRLQKIIDERFSKILPVNKVDRTETIVGTVDTHPVTEKELSTLPDHEKEIVKQVMAMGLNPVEINGEI